MPAEQYEQATAAPGEIRAVLVPPEGDAEQVRVTVSLEITDDAAAELQTLMEELFPGLDVIIEREA